MHKLIIDWSHLPTYTTIMGIFAGGSLIFCSKGRKKTTEEGVEPGRLGT